MTDDPSAYRRAEQALWQQYGLDPDEQFLDFTAGGGRVRVQSVDEGPPVVFVHGNPNAGAIWAPLVAHLAGRPAGLRCVLIDRPGCGLSEPLRRIIPPETLGAELLRVVMDGLNLPRAAIVASSLGGALAYPFAEAWPKHVTDPVPVGCGRSLRKCRCRRTAQGRATPRGAGRAAQSGHLSWLDSSAIHARLIRSFLA
ncbi:alpha/beta fold hydrolase [Deinococcus sp.]|uniref:alpha/beta fold hydrolase n=1 Tax=Deinococcus sp. TaxID=47478 RepID=UPI0028698269|nr:alpha/beta fold hydrolase [Deinococcus sp.]